MKKILLTGITSTHIWPTLEELSQREGIEVFGIKPPKAKTPVGDNIFASCITDLESLTEIYEKVHPTHILHGAGVCDLDACEGDPERAHRLNVMGTQNILSLKKPDQYFLYCSADLVFSGKNPPAQGYDESANPDPVSVVGKTLRLAEQEVLKDENNGLIRIGLPMGTSIQGKKGAVDWIEGRFKANKPATLFYDEYRSPIYLEEMGKLIADIFLEEPTGIYHAGGPKKASLYEMGEEILTYGDYDSSCLKGRYVHEQEVGPPRILDVSLNSTKAIELVGWEPRPWPR